MIGSDIILFPESGQEFNTSLKIAALYSERVRLDAPIHSDLWAHADEINKHKKWSQNITPQIGDYCKYMSEHAESLAMLQQEGIVFSLFGKNYNDPPWKELNNLIKALLKDQNSRELIHNFLISIKTDLDKLPPSTFHVLIVPELINSSCEALPLKEEYVRNILTVNCFAYIVGLTYIAEVLGVGLCTWSREFRSLLFQCRQLLNVNSDLEQTGKLMPAYIKDKMATVIIEKHLPLIDDLPFEEILTLRQRRKPELESFRVALGELTTQVDPNQTTSKLEAQIQTIVAAKVDPAVDQLTRAIAQSKYEFLKRLPDTATDAAKATLPAAIALLAGAPLDVSATLGGIGGLAAIAKGIATEIAERKRILNASQWSILFHLNKRVQR